jgi:hypothetical protein
MLVSNEPLGVSYKSSLRNVPPRFVTGTRAKPYAYRY